MNMTSGRNESFGFLPANGPPPAKAPQSAKHDRTRAAVAVSRWSPRSAAHSSGTAARKLSALLATVCSMSGLKASTPTASAAINAVADVQTLSALKARKSPIAQSTTDRRNDERPHHVAQPPRYPEGDEARPVGVTGDAQADHADGRADHRAGPEADERELRDRDRRIEGSAAIGPDVDQVAGRERRKRVAGGDRRGAYDRAHQARVGHVGRRVGGPCRHENCGPNPRTPQQHRRQGKTGRAARSGSHSDGARRAPSLLSPARNSRLRRPPIRERTPPGRGDPAAPVTSNLTSAKRVTACPHRVRSPALVLRPLAAICAGGQSLRDAPHY